MHSPPVCFLHKCFQILCRAKFRINGIIITDIIFMIGNRAKYRRKIKGITSKGHNIIKFLCNSPQISSCKGKRCRNISPAAVNIRGIFILISHIEAVYKYLIKDSLFHPVYFFHNIRLINIRILKEIIEALRIVIVSGNTILREKAALFSIINIEYICQSRILQL